jgi:hypothetical protein
MLQAVMRKGRRRRGGFVRVRRRDQHGLAAQPHRDALLSGIDTTDHPESSGLHATLQLEGDGFELSVKIRPEENCGFPGPRNRRNSTPSRAKIVSKKGVRSGQRLIPSLARDTAPLIYWRNWVSLPTRPGSPRFRCRYPVLDGGVRDIKIHSNTVPPIRSVTTATVQHRF